VILMLPLHVPRGRLKVPWDVLETPLLGDHVRQADVGLARVVMQRVVSLSEGGYREILTIVE
jgi:hypothetical protein